jgi:transcription elongation factor Elf1
MPPFVFAQCPQCKSRNRYDLAELKQETSALYRGANDRIIEGDEEFAVTCGNCGERFKITLPRSERAQGGTRHADPD